MPPFLVLEEPILDLPTGRPFAGLSRLTRELIVLVLALLAGFVAVPLLTWVVGNRILGPYTHGTNPNGGPMALLGDFFAGLAHGAITFWVVGLGPLLLILFLRLAFALLRPRPGQARPER